jgi:hypothetical protein
MYSLKKIVTTLVIASSVAVSASAAILPSVSAQNAAVATNSGAQQVALDSVRAQVVVGQLSAAEAESLAFMREEEKLARDVYLTLYEQWGAATFQSIAASEQTHTDSVKALLARYSVPDPAADMARGVFANADLQALYDQLVETGSASLASALRVGAVIEEIDILDLRERLAQTDETDIQRVYQNLLNGSYNHLRAFTSALQRQTGEVYQPQYLSQSEYEAIIGGSNGSARQGRR